MNEQITDQQLNAAESSENGKIISLYAQATQLYHHILVNTELGEEALNYLPLVI